MLEDGDRGVVLVTAPGLGRPRPNRLGEARGLQAISAGESEVEVETHLWGPAGFRLDATRRYPRAAS